MLTKVTKKLYGIKMLKDIKEPHEYICKCNNYWEHNNKLFYDNQNYRVIINYCFSNKELVKGLTRNQISNHFNKVITEKECIL